MVKSSDKIKKNTATAVDPPTTSKWERAIENFRPDRKSGIRYNIDQTRAIADAGDTKIIYHNTKAKYKYPLPDEIPLQEDSFREETIEYYSKGIGPLQEYLEDTVAKKIEQFQQRAIEDLKKRMKKTVTERKQTKIGLHATLCEMAGPDWYQELSSKQLKAAENLKNAILADVKSKEIIQTQIIIGQLGLVLRPNCTLIDFALKHCCNCPIEFLLLIYHFINPNRTTYTINDRILLSSVAHLSMQSTLMEMHIRLPSPPPNKKLKVETNSIKETSKSNIQNKEKQKKTEIKSPYLEEYTFKPEPPKHEGVYKPKIKMYPNNPYFKYLENYKLSCMMQNETGEDVYEEYLKKINSIENQLKQMTAVLQPEDDPSGVLNEAIKYTAQIKEDIKDNPLFLQRQSAQEVYNKLWEKLNRPAPMLQMCHLYSPCNLISNKIKDKVFTDIRENSITSFNSTEVSKKVSKQKGNKIKEHEEDKSAKQSESTIKPIVKTNSNTKPSIPSINNITENNYNVEVNVNISSKYEKVFVESRNKHVTNNIQKTCECAITIDKKISNNLEEVDSLEEVENNSDSEPILFQQTDALICPGCGHLLERIACTCDKSTFYSTSSSSSRTIDDSDDGYTYMKDDLEKERKKALQVKRVSKRSVNTRPKYVISGVKICDGEQIFIISDVYEKQCDCLYRYEKQMEAYLDQEKRRRLEEQTKESAQKHIITGVARSPSGNPIYILGGVIPPHRCYIVDEREKILREHETMTSKGGEETSGNKRMQYLISGVKKTDDGEVYLIGDAKPVNECDCLKLFQRFYARHSVCIDSFEEFKIQIAQETHEYLAEMDPVYRAKHCSEYCDYQCENVDSEELEEETSTIKKVDIVTSASENIKSDDKNDDEDFVDHEITITISVNDRKCSSHDDSGSEKEKTNETVDDIKLKPSSETGENKISEKRNSLKPMGTEEFSDSTRYFILKTLPTNKEKQQELLQKLLKSLADDGFPLAKLPESYKLPIFDLWMDMRCRRIYTDIDLEQSFVQTKSYWNHTQICVTNLSIPELPLTGREKMHLNASHIKKIRKMAGEANNDFYTRLRHTLIEQGREFFATMAYYQYPFPKRSEGLPTYRDTYFAYFPSREEDAVAYHPWQSGQVRRK